MGATDVEREYRTTVTDSEQVRAKVDAVRAGG
jgi:hypothetical protein